MLADAPEKACLLKAKPDHHGIDHDRRHWPRSSPSIDSDLAIVIDPRGFPLPCTLVDEGRGGICIQVECDSPPPSGVAVRLIHGGARRTGCVRHATMLAPNQWKLGIAWTPAPRSLP